MLLPTFIYIFLFGHLSFPLISLYTTSTHHLTPLTYLLLFCFNQVVWMPPNGTRRCYSISSLNRAIEEEGDPEVKREMFSFRLRSLEFDDIIRVCYIFSLYTSWLLIILLFFICCESVSSPPFTPFPFFFSPPFHYPFFSIVHFSLFLTHLYLHTHSNKRQR